MTYRQAVQEKIKFKKAMREKYIKAKQVVVKRKTQEDAYDKFITDPNGNRNSTRLPPAQRPPAPNSKDQSIV